jgi:hypothetical protein
MNSPYDSCFWQLRDLQRTLDSLKPQLDSLQTIPPGVQAQIEQFRLLEEQFTLPSDYLSAIREIQGSIDAGLSFKALPALAKFDLPFLDEIQRQQSSIEAIVSQFAELSFHQPISAQIVEALAPVEALLETNRVQVDDLRAISQPIRAFQNFAAQQIELVSRATESFAIESRLSFVSEAGELLENMVKGFELGALIRHKFSSAEPLPEVGLIDLYAKNNIYARLQQRAEAVDFDSDDFDAEDFVIESCEGKLSGNGYRLVKLVRDLNVEAEREGKEPPFKATTNTLHACGALPSIIAQDEGSFNTIVDQLYFLLYEGSGSAKRLTESYGSELLGALWRLKDLRLAARHDVDHGSALDIQAKRKKIGQAFKELVGLVLPKEAEDWCRAQLALYEDLIEMLENLWFNEDDDTEDSEPTAREDG